MWDSPGRQRCNGRPRSFCGRTYERLLALLKDPRGNKLPFLAVRRKPSGAAKPEGLRPTASFNPVIYFRAAPKQELAVSESRAPATLNHVTQPSMALNPKIGHTDRSRQSRL